MKFVWDTEKAAVNQRKHGVTLEEATTPLRDVLAATGHDPDHSSDEDRDVTFGVSEKNRLLVVSPIEEGDVVRIISSRAVTPGERKIYEEG